MLPPFFPSLADPYVAEPTPPIADQIITRIGSVYEVTLPSVIIEMLSLFALSISFGLDAISTPLACLGYTGYLRSLLFWLYAPAVLIGISMIACLILSKNGLKGSVLLALPAMLQILFLVYPIVTKKCFDAFPCHDFGGEDQFLKSDVSVRCDPRGPLDVFRIDYNATGNQTHDTSQHQEIMFTAWSGILAYPVGLFTVCTLLLFKCRRAISTQVPSELSKAIDFLHREYEPVVFWWELVEMVRRFLLIGLFVVIEKGTITQLLLGLAVSVVHVVCQMEASPYRELTNDYLALASSVSILM